MSPSCLGFDRRVSLCAALCALCACGDDSATSLDGGGGQPSSKLAALAESRDTWEELVADSGDTYWYEEENCHLAPAPNGEVSVVQVEDGEAKLVERVRAECTSGQRRYETFEPKLLPELYDECRKLIERQPEAELVFDDRGVVQECTYITPEPKCFDACGEGFYLRRWDLGVRAPDASVEGAGGDGGAADGGADAGR